MTGDHHAAHVDLRQPSQERKPRKRLIKFVGLQQFQLRSIPPRLTILRECAGHEIPARDALIGGQPDPLPAQEEKDVPVASEDRAERREIGRGQRALVL
jgi:hypothetical protein